MPRSPLTTAAFWIRLDRRIDGRVRRVARPVRGILTAATGTGIRLAGYVAARAGEVLSDIEIAQHYGFASVPPAGTEVIAVPIGGASSHQVVVGEIDPAGRPTDLLSSESAMYTVAGNRIVCHADGSIEISTPAGTALSIDAAGIVSLAGGGAGVARVGDSVQVIGTDSTGGALVITSATITGGSSTVQAGG